MCFRRWLRHDPVNLLAYATLPPAELGPAFPVQGPHGTASMGNRWDEWLALWRRFTHAPERALEAARARPPTPDPDSAPQTARPTAMIPRQRPRPAADTRLRTPPSVPPAVAHSAIVVGFAPAWFASAHNLGQCCRPPPSHLTLDRRDVDGPNNNLVQLGTVWLPLPHLALLPLV